MECCLAHFSSYVIFTEINLETALSFHVVPIWPLNLSKDQTSVPNLKEFFHPQQSPYM
jgi:hypothetical protein